MHTAEAQEIARLKAVIAKLIAAIVLLAIFAILAWFAGLSYGALHTLAS
jgi:hypothetical protein